ncbi:MAG: thioredoxin family protein [Pseudodesulfovibrio sp.]|uniref:thioredoxin family protein n=1 Tax=Pseudodesulfovibrio sp. TaxID=2035812 RepID=UPI003D11ED15
MRKLITALLLCLALAFLSQTARAGEPTAADLISGAPQALPVPGRVTMVDLGAHACIPCKMMTPIIEELSREYEGKVAIAFIDVWKHHDEVAKYGIRAIPTQIFYDARGKERFRHIGFMDKESIKAKLTELGAAD